MQNSQHSYPLLNGIALFLLMLITGVFWGTWFTLIRSLGEFPATEFMHIGKVIIANVAVPMRILMPTGVVLPALQPLCFREDIIASFDYALRIRLPF